MANGEWQIIIIRHLPDFPRDWVADGSAIIVLQSERVQVVPWTIEPIPGSLLFASSDMDFAPCSFGQPECLVRRQYYLNFTSGICLLKSSINLYKVGDIIIATYKHKKSEAKNNTHHKNCFFNLCFESIG